MDGRDHKPLPSNTETEQIVLAAVLIDNAQMSTLAESLEVEDFYSPRHRRIYAAMLELFSAQKNINPILIGEVMAREGSLDSIGGVPSITNLTFGIPYFTNLDDYITVVKHHSNRRRLIRLCGQIAVRAEDDEHDELFTAAQTLINDLCTEVESGKSEGFFTPLDRIIDDEVMAVLDDLRHGRSQKMMTGFPGIDFSTGGVAKSDVVLVAADTGKGKSAFALQLAHNFAANGIPSAFLAGEMTNKENVLRLLSQLAQVTNLNWSRHISESDYQGIVAWAQHIKNSPIYFEHRISDLQTLGTHLRSIVQRYKVKVLVIDYIQLFKMEKLDRRKRNERIAECSQEVKRLANELDIAIIEVAQFNREGAKSAQPGLHDLEGSGQLEKDASLIFILEIPDDEYTADDGRKYHPAKIRVVKGRNVGKSEIEGRFYGRSVRFEFN